MKIFTLKFFFAYILLFLSFEMAKTEVHKIPDDVAFCIADLKFTDKKLKILEFGGGQRSGFKGFRLLYGEGKMWGNVWRYLSQFQLPIWDIECQSNCQVNRNEIATDLFLALGGQKASCSDDMLTKILKAKSWQHDEGTDNLSDYKALVISRMKIGRFADLKLEIEKRFPGAIFVGNSSNEYVFNKVATNNLFQNDSDLKQFRPACKVCEKKYAPELAQSIINEIQAEVYVIKPVDAYQGDGVIFTRRNELDKVLRLILGDVESLKKDASLEKDFLYWQKDQNTTFLVEEYVPSKKVMVKGKPYDPTMRVVFGMHLLDGKIYINILGSYWKLPVKPLTAQGTFTKLHKSNIYQGNRTRSAPVSTHDAKNVYKIMRHILKKVYYKMLVEQGVIKN